MSPDVDCSVPPLLSVSASTCSEGAWTLAPGWSVRLVAARVSVPLVWVTSKPEASVTLPVPLANSTSGAVIAPRLRPLSGATTMKDVAALPVTVPVMEFWFRLTPPVVLVKLSPSGADKVPVPDTYMLEPLVMLTVPPEERLPALVTVSGPLVLFCTDSEFVAVTEPVLSSVPVLRVMLLPDKVPATPRSPPLDAVNVTEPPETLTPEPTAMLPPDVTESEPPTEELLNATEEAVSTMVTEPVVDTSISGELTLVRLMSPEPELTIRSVAAVTELPAAVSVTLPFPLADSVTVVPLDREPVIRILPFDPAVVVSTRALPLPPLIGPVVVRSPPAATRSVPLPRLDVPTVVGPPVVMSMVPEAVVTVSVLCPVLLSVSVALPAPVVTLRVPALSVVSPV